MKLLLVLLVATTLLAACESTATPQTGNGTSPDNNAIHVSGSIQSGATLHTR
ncbi:MAG: hypothetical protein FWD61_08995 [Phycisphaerales bacterium]|nr:hypothetical protein [Phycisphaerales bacterium]